jgi:hypothetical protein
MPNPGVAMPAFREVFGALDEFYYFEFNVPEQASAGTAVEVRLDGKTAARIRVDDAIELVFSNQWGGSSLRSNRRKQTQGLASVTIERTAAGLRICLNQACSIVGAKHEPASISAHAASANIAIFNAQAIDSAGDYSRFTAETTVVQVGPAPRRVLAWERMAKTLYHTALNLYAGYDVCRQWQYFDYPGCDAIHQRAPVVAASMARQLGQWQNWRTFDATLPSGSLATDPDFGAWDKGNWANGYLPYAVVLLAYLADDASWGATLDAVLPAFERLGADYLRSDIFDERAGHWIKRSNNHGGIVLGNGYAALLLANRCEENELAATLRESFRKVAEGSFEQGVYAESFTYLQVFVMESLAAVFTRQQCFGESFPVAFSQMYGSVDLAEIAAASAFLTTPRGKLLVPFGDCCGSSAWRRDSLEVLGQSMPQLQRLVAKELYTEEGSPAILHLSSDAPMSARESYPDPAPSPTLECFRSDLGIAAARLPTKFGLLQSAVSSTRRHLTHNKDWDLGSIYLSLDGVTIIGERTDGNPSRLPQAVRHSTAWSSGISAQHPGCFSDSMEQCPSRRINGQIFHYASTPTSCSARARVNAGTGSFRSWQMDTDDSGHPRVKLTDFIDTQADGQVLHAHLELPGEGISTAQKGRSFWMQHGPWRALISVTGYEISSLQTRNTPHGSYTSLDLATTELPRADGVTEAGTITVTLHAEEEARRAPPLQASPSQ